MDYPMENNGFLSPSLDNFKETIRKQYPEHYDAAIEVNCYAQQLQYKLDIQKNYTDTGIQINTDKLLSAILYSRVISTYQAFLLISQRGMAQQSKMLLRCIFESLFPLVAIQKNKDYSQHLIVADEIDRFKAFNKVIRHRTRQDPNDPSIPEVQALADASKKIIEENGLKKIGVIDNAEKAGLLDWYDTAYSMLSWTVHSSMRSLQEHLVLDGDKDIHSLKNEPEIEEFDHLYSTAIEAVVFAVIAAGTIFDVDIDAFEKKTQETIAKLGELVLKNG